MRRLFRTLIFLGLLGIGFVVYAHWRIGAAAKDRLYDDATNVPPQKVALVLGTSRLLGDGRENLYFRYRMDAAEAVWRAGGCEFLILSGGNPIVTDDEPHDMYHELVARGLPPNRMLVDCAGFRTLDSMVRAREVFGQESLIVVSQAFHNRRAIYLGRAHGIDAVGFNAEDVGRRSGIKTRLREVAARGLAVVDVWFGREPKFLGDPIEVNEANAGPVNDSPPNR